MFEVIKGAAAMAVVVTALVVIASAMVTHDSSVAPLALGVGMVIGGWLGWRKHCGTAKVRNCGIDAARVASGANSIDELRSERAEKFDGGGSITIT